MAKKETDVIKSVLRILDTKQILDECQTDAIRGMLQTLVAPSPAKVPAIEALTVRLGKFIRRFDSENPKAVKAADATLCQVCAHSLKFARIVPFVLKGHNGYAHYACAPWIHPNECECVPCRTRRARVGKPLNFTGHTKMLPPQNMEQLLAQKSAVRVSAFSAKAKLRLCACGHDGSCHFKDELDNLLQCQMQGCPCDHFHYQTEETADSVSAAAGN